VRAYYIKNPRSYRYSGLRGFKASQANQPNAPIASLLEVAASVLLLSFAFAELAYIAVTTWGVQ
jgi:hypothetical protein